MSKYKNVGKFGFVREIRKISNELGRPPTTTEYNEISKHTDQGVTYHFGSWREALIAAGLDPSNRRDRRGGEEIPEEELLDDLRAGAEALNRPPTSTEINEFGNYSTGAYRRRFGSIDKALEAAGLDPNHPDMNSANARAPRSYEKPLKGSDGHGAPEKGEYHENKMLECPLCNQPITLSLRNHLPCSKDTTSGESA